MASIKDIVTALGDFSGGDAWTLVGVLAAVGSLTMAALQVMKQLLPVRRAFQKRKIEDWIGSGSGDGPKTVQLLVDLATGGQSNAFFDLPIEQLVAQMNAAGQITLDYPANYQLLLTALCKGADPADIAAVVAGSPQPPGSQQAFLDARNRVSHRMQRNLDGLQIAIGDRWQFWLQFTSILGRFVNVPMTFRKRGGRKLIIAPDGVGAAAGANR